LLAVDIKTAGSPDIPAWLELAREVEPLFGPMAGKPAFRASLQAAVLEGRGLCAWRGDQLAGAVSVRLDDNSIAWLAVAEDCRGKGAGRALALAAIERLLPPFRPVLVQTFAPGAKEGEAARRLYLSLGFQDGVALTPTPTGFPTVRMMRPVQFFLEKDVARFSS
jgi:GNAT superfamily N-acetyltransferase